MAGDTAATPRGMSIFTRSGSRWSHMMASVSTDHRAMTLLESLTHSQTVAFGAPRAPRRRRGGARAPVVGARGHRGTCGAPRAPRGRRPPASAPRGVPRPASAPWGARVGRAPIAKASETSVGKYRCSSVGRSGCVIGAKIPAYPADTWGRKPAAIFPNETDSVGPLPLPGLDGQVPILADNLKNTAKIAQRITSPLVGAGPTGWARGTPTRRTFWARYRVAKPRSLSSIHFCVSKQHAARWPRATRPSCPLWTCSVPLD